jgi:Na+/melibiose symporter-like transporter
MTTVAAASLAPRLPAQTLFAYGVFGMPLAMAALPLYVNLPKFYGDHLGVDLALLGGMLLALRLADGVIDPLLGVLSDFRTLRAQARRGCSAALVSSIVMRNRQWR